MTQDNYIRGQLQALRKRSETWLEGFIHRLMSFTQGHYPLSAVSNKSIYTKKWPWFCGIRNKNMKRILYGGALLNPWWVLTCSHCYDKTKKCVVYNVDNGPENWKTRSLANEIVSLNPDLILIKLKKEAEIAEFPIVNDDPKREKKQAVFSGWAANQEEPQKVGGFGLCTPSTSLRFNAFESCVEGEGQRINKPLCGGDSGGPLIVEENSSLYLIGLLWSGYYCKKDNYRGEFSSVAFSGKEICNKIKCS